MSIGKPWYVALFERDWHDVFAPGGLRSLVDPGAYAEQTEREAAFVAEALQLPAGAAALDLCCGWGRHAVLLARRGYRMTGLDLSAYHMELAADAARTAGVDVRWIQRGQDRLRAIPRHGISIGTFARYSR